MVKVKESSCGVEVGKKFGKWTVIGHPFSVGSAWQYRAVVQCDCGAVSAVVCGNLASGKSESCPSCANTGKHMSHGGSQRRGKHPLYGVWTAMLSRCSNPNNRAFKDYGGRGISVCDEWSQDFAAFREWSESHGYARGLQIDRIDNELGYSPDNCRFVPCQTNQRNRRSNKKVTAFGETKCIAEWADDSRCVVARSALAYRLASGWNPETALTKP